MRAVEHALRAVKDVSMRQKIFVGIDVGIVRLARANLVVKS
jgi:hypothetical protein